ncbi:MAG: hypothetical protein GY804_15225 [Alphaproteobacteria bacterium]|nr:hypothetical protein [Alphaproteobacteria bacterium]
MHNSLIRRMFLVVAFFSILFGISISNAYAAKSGMDAQTLMQLQMIQKANPSMNINDLRAMDGEPSSKNNNLSKFKMNANDLKRLLAKGEKELSRLEKDYEDRINEAMSGAEDAEIEAPVQYGYALFENGDEANNNSLIGAMYDSYVMGSGDIVVLTLRGGQSMTQRVEVDKEGRIIFPDLSPVMALGRTFGDIKKELEASVKEQYVKTDVYISLGELKISSIVVAGEVNNPGVVNVSGLSSVVDALISAGGVKKSGSLRNIHIVRGAKTINVDLYDLLFAKDTINTYNILSGDKVVVPPIGNTIAIVGEVKRPGIYELSKNDSKDISVSDIKKIAAGVLRKRNYRYTRIYANSDGYDVVKSINVKKKVRVSNSDIIIVAGKHNSSRDSVLVTGHVAVPGLRSLSEYSSVKSIVEQADMFKENPYLLLGVLQRKNPVTLSRDYIPLNISAIIQGQDDDVFLRGGDRLIVLGRDDIRYLSSYEVQMTLSRKNPDGSEPDGYEDKLDQILKARNLNKKVNTNVENNEELLALMAKTEVGSSGEGQTCKGLNELFLLVSNSPKGRFSWARVNSKVLDELKYDRFGNNCPVIYDRYPDLLPFLLDYAVVLDGELRSPGIYPVLDGANLSSALSAAGGFFRTADLTNIEVSNFSKLSNMMVSKENGDIDKGLGFRKIINANEVPLAAVKLSPGDAVRFNSMFSERDDGGVLLAGEFIHPGIYQIKRGEKLSDVIKRAGGLTDEAYPVGAIFTRESIKKAEKNMLKIAMKDVQSNFLHAISSQDIKPSAVEAILKPLINISTIEVGLGRMVVEADPTVLQVRPNLDTTLHPSDKLYMPKRSNHVMVVGEVLSPGAMQFMSGINSKEYIQMAGGIKESADEDKIFVVMPNGMARHVSISSWKFSSLDIPPGSTIFVPRDVAPLTFRLLFQETLGIISKAGIAAAAIISITDD